MRHAAEIENASPPDVIERVAELSLLTLGRRVSGLALGRVNA